jgi:GDP/UDP-N,N'-diacetylbacillosamine 2-epimerase (hydrolysing)
LGDRYEILAAAFSGLVSNIPIAHIAGGEKTLGSIDESIRHSITKMAWWHFVALDESRNRVLQLGENPNNVYVVSGINIDRIVKTKLLEKKDLEEKLDFTFGKNNLMITVHPETNTKLSSSAQISELLTVLESLGDINCIFSAPNADSGGREIKKIIKSYVHNNKNKAVYFESLGYLKYLSTLQFVDAMVGNSSSGISEAPSFKIGTINIGDRQKGRPKAKSVIDCEPTKASIKKAFETLYSEDFQKILLSVKNLYGEGDSTDKIMKILLEAQIPSELKKVFYDL